MMPKRVPRFARRLAFLALGLAIYFIVYAVSQGYHFGEPSSADWAAHPCIAKVNVDFVIPMWKGGSASHCSGASGLPDTGRCAVGCGTFSHLTAQNTTRLDAHRTAQAFLSNMACLRVGNCNAHGYRCSGMAFAGSGFARASRLNCARGTRRVTFDWTP